MSRRSLRLDGGLLDRSLPRSSASFSVAGAKWRSSRPSLSQRHSASCSESLLLGSPQKAVSQSLHNSSLHSVTSDASLISSLLEESSIQESTLVETFWGLDEDADPRESTIVTNDGSTLVGPDDCCAKHSVQMLGRVCCKDCNCPSSPKTDLETSTVYCRDRKGRTAAARSGDGGLMALKEPSLKELHPVGSLCCIAADMFRWISKQWSHGNSSSYLSRLFIGVLLLFLFSLFWFLPAGFYSLLPGFNVADVPGLSSVRSLLSSHSMSAGGTVEESAQSPPPTAEMPPKEVPSSAPPPTAAALDSERLVQMEQSLKALWQEMEAAGRRAEQSHKELLRLYAELHQQMSHSSEQESELWMRGLMEQQLSPIRRRLHEERRQREQMRQQDLFVQKTQMARLDQLELQLQQVTARSRELLEADLASPAALPATDSTAVDKQSQTVLHADVSRLEAALVDVRRDVDGLSGCQDGCQQLDRIQQTISDQVLVLIREEVRVLIYGNQLTQGGESVLTESLLQWLSQQFISAADLREALSSLEFNILQNISRRLQQQQLHREETIREDVLDTAGNAVTKEEVHVMMTEALRLFSQDRIGLADYALESGGGSILSTRCSETYETKAALLSLFGVPLWYFSQSPRAVIQPDIHPGNCWAFKGSKGFLVIQLSMSIFPTAVTMEHIPKSLAPSRTLRSAPRDFSVYGLKDERQERGKLLGNYTYDEDGEDLQTFIISENQEAFQIIEVQVLSNWGHPEYTCMYRFRVHGTPSDV